MTLLAGFSPPLADAQHASRRILKAMSEPGVVVTLPFSQGFGDLSPAATVLLLTLLDQTSDLWLDPMLHSERLCDNLRLHTGVTLSHRQQAMFALMLASSEPRPGDFAVGHHLTPEQSTTLIIEVPALNGGLTLRLSGAALRESRAIAPQLPSSVVAWLRERSCPPSPGVDLIFTCGEAMLALPRTVQVAVC